MKGARRDGRVHAAGSVEIATRDSSLAVKLEAVDLTSFQSYLLRSHDARVVSGILDMDLKSDVRGNHLRAPGTVSISDLKLEPAGGPWGTFLGVPRSAVLELLKSSGDRITLHFVLEGNLDNPRFSLNEALSRRLAVSLANALQVNIGRVTEGAERIGSRGVEAAGEVMKGFGNAVQDLFGGRKETSSPGLPSCSSWPFSLSLKERRLPEKAPPRRGGRVPARCEGRPGFKNAAALHLWRTFEQDTTGLPEMHPYGR